MAGVRLPVLVGPTGVGKTAVACALLAHWALEVISADSRQVYRRLNIGTAKPSRKWLARVPHHGIDLIDPGHRYSAGLFARDAPRWIDEVRSRGNLPVIVGGTGLYIRALTDGLFAEPPLDRDRRRAMGDWAETLDPRELLRWAGRLDRGFRGGGRQRAVRAIEVAVLTGRPLSHWQRVAKARGPVAPWYVHLTLPRPVLQHRILARARE
ncbi:MAG: tRNA (adenosine(37)-N6)-dimethylallyltransferase, partial [Gemmatimonadales bacterium]